MRILHVIPTYVPAYRYGGPIRSVHGLAEAQAAAGDRVEVFTTDADGAGRLDVPTGRPVRVGAHEARYFATRFPRRLARAPDLARALRAEIGGFEVVHLHSVFLWPTWAAARAARSAGRPYLVSPRGMLDAELIARRGALRKRLWLALVERRALAASARIVTTSPRESSGIRRLGLDLAPIAEVPNGVDLASLAEPRAEELSAAIREALSGGPYALFLGRLSWKKGIERLLEALVGAEPARLVVAGPDDEGLRPALEELAGRRKVASRVRFLEEVDGADRVALLRAARVAVLPSDSENFGNSVLEALACGVPAIVSPGVGLAPEVAESDAGWVVEPRPEALAAALREAFGDDARCRTAGENGRRRVEQAYTWQAVARRMRAVYEEVLAA